MDSLLAAFNGLPSPMQAVLLGMVMVVVLKLAIDGALALRRRLKNGDSLVLIAFNAIVSAAIDNAYKGCSGRTRRYMLTCLTC